MFDFVNLPFPFTISHCPLRVSSKRLWPCTPHDCTTLHPYWSSCNCPATCSTLWTVHNNLQFWNNASCSTCLAFHWQWHQQQHPHHCFYQLCKTFNNFSTDDVNLALPEVDIAVAEPGIWHTTASYSFLVSEDAGTRTEKLQTVIRSFD